MLLLSILFCSYAKAQSSQTFVGGYGEMNYQNYADGAVPRLDISRFVLYLDHTFDMHWMFRSETEIEHVKIEGGAGGEIGLEQAYLDFHAKDWLGWRAGLMVLPIGIMNQTHEPNTYFSVLRPIFDQVVIPSTWREIGTGIYGNASRTISYQLYLSEGIQPTAIGMDGTDPAKQEGWAGAATSDFLAGSDASHPSLSGKIDYRLAPGLTLGASGYLERGLQQDVSHAFVLGDLDAEYEHGPWRVRAEAAYITTGDAADTATVPPHIAGGYAELAFDLFSLWNEPKAKLYGFARYETFQFEQNPLMEPTPIATWERHEAVIGGFAYKPMNELILKADYQWTNTDAPLERREFGLGAGYVF
jgi:hypothetical protein